VDDELPAVDASYDEVGRRPDHYQQHTTGEERGPAHEPRGRRREAVEDADVSVHLQRHARFDSRAHDELSDLRSGAVAWRASAGRSTLSVSWTSPATRASSTSSVEAPM